MSLIKTGDFARGLLRGFRQRHLSGLWGNGEGSAQKGGKLKLHPRAQRTQRRKTAVAVAGSGHSRFFLFVQCRLTGSQCFLDNTFLFYVFHGCHSQSLCIKACGTISLHPKYISYPSFTVWRSHRSGRAKSRLE